jgi:CIC family chloride channel protein
VRRLWRRVPAIRAEGGARGGAPVVRWVLLGVAIGLVAGLGAIAFTYGIELAERLFLGFGADYRPPRPVGDGLHGVVPPGRRWALPIVVALGAFLGGVVVHLLAQEAEGHGTDAAITAFHFKAGRVRRRVAPVKLIASSLTIGAGGSGGREGPTAQISSGFGAALADWLHLSDADRRLCLVTGMGAGIGAIFRAPLGGAMFGAEVLYKRDVEVEAIVPSLIASIVGYSVFGAVVGWEPVFGDQARFGFDDPAQLVAFAVLGCVCGLVGRAYARTFRAARRLFGRLPGPWVARPALGGLLVGLLGVALPEVLGTGYGWAQIGMGPGVADLALWTVLVLPFAKILATSLSIGSGGAGGIFGPGIVIGGMLGAGVWRLGQGLPGVPDAAAPMVIVGMMALFGSIAHVPLAALLMVAEMTGNIAMLAPAMVAVGVASLVVGDETIYTAQQDVRADSPAHRDLPVVPAVGARVFALPVGDGSPLTAAPLGAVPLPADTVILSVRRDGHDFIPSKETALRPGDVVTVLSGAHDQAAVEQALVGGEHPRT